MSLILDALKKSEQERRRERAPDLQSIHQAQPLRAHGSEKKWGWALLLVVNAAAVTGWWWYQQRAVQPVATDVRAQAPTAPVVAPEPAPVQSAPVEMPPALDDGQFTRIEPRAAAVKPRIDVTAPIEEFSELAPDVRTALPAMTFSFHVYSADPHSRTIIINNQRMREGEEISAGVMLESITEDGVILAMDHHRIHINVLTGW